MTNAISKSKLTPETTEGAFAKETGTTIKHFVIRAKIDTAENLLKYSEHSSSEISFALGFSSQSAFISVFKKENGMTPKQSRDRYSAEPDVLNYDSKKVSGEKKL